MANHSVIVLEKPMQHLSFSDWYSRLEQLKNVADARQKDSFDLRHSARTLRNETRIQTEWGTYNNNALLADRVSDINRWRILIEQLLDRIEKEMELLRDEKASTERELESMVTPLLVVSECLTMRDGRLGAELTHDDADTELKRELCIIENNQKFLQKICQTAWEKLNRLEDVKFKLGIEIANKKEAKSIDVEQLKLNKFSANITFKPDPTRIPKNAITYEAWQEHTEYIENLAENELADTYSIRESLSVSREKARNILNAQQDRTEYAIRKRIFETQKVRNELKWQEFKMKEEMEKCLKEIKTLEHAFRDKTDNLKLAESRLENRAQRSGKELVIDEPYKGLCNEVYELRKIRKAIIDKIDCAKATYNKLEEHVLRIDKDLNNKQHSLMTDIRALDLRQRLRTGEFGKQKSDPETQTDRNIKLTQMEDEIPPI